MEGKKLNGQPDFLMSHVNLGGPLFFWSLLLSLKSRDDDGNSGF